MKLMENIDDMINEYKNLQGVEVEQLDSLLEKLERKEAKEGKRKNMWFNLNEYSIYLIPVVFAGLSLSIEEEVVNDIAAAVIISMLMPLIVFEQFMYTRISDNLTETRKEMSETFKIKADAITRDYLVGLKETVDYAQKAKEISRDRE
jgi:hypothetical protein